MKNNKLKNLKKIFSIGILLFVFADSYAQQLISNGSFETTAAVVRYRQGPVWNQPTFATGWYPINTPDIFTDHATANDYWFNENGINLTCYPEAFALDNQFGQQNPRAHTMAADGNTWNNNYVFLFTSGEFIYQQLPYALVAGDCYELSYWINRGDVSGKAYCAQAVVSSTDISTLSLPHTLPSDAIYLSTIDQPNVGQQGFIVDKLNWTKVTFRFKAQGGERYITIGDFDQYSEKIEVLGPTDCGSSNSCSSTCTAIIGSGGGYYYFYDDVSLVPVSASSFPNPVSYANSTISTNYTGANLLLTGNITISGNRTWSNCQVRCNASTKIFIPTGSSLTINSGTVLKAGCDMMWQGMIVEGSGRFYSLSSTVEDALTALTVNGTGGWQITNSTFRKNERDIVINGTSQYTNFIKGATFEHTTPLANPAQGIGGHGIEGVVINPQTSNTAIAIGGPNTADICQFLGGEYGIRSNNANVNVERCLFSGINKVGIDFQGNNPSILRKLTVTSSSIVNSKRCILSQHRTDLTVQYSSFAGATEHAIEWDDNHDGHLLIGDLTDPAKGNTFQNNAWTAVTVWDNKTMCTLGNAAIASNNNNLASYTSIVIANNNITTPAYAGGLLIGEWALGSDVSYHDLEISKNSISGSVKGIQMYNIKGWSGAFSSNPPPTIPISAVSQNQLAINTTVAPTAFGINAENAPGFDFRYNLIGSNNPTNWQNNGIRLQNAEFSQVYNNGIECGTGISTGLDMLSSGIYCNILQNNVAGIVLGWAYLCPDVLHPHGSVLKAYSNNFVLDQAATVNIHDYYSDVSHNNWVWDFTVTGTSPKLWYSGIPSIPTGTTPNQSSSSIITSWTGAFDCPYDPNGLIVNVGGSNVHATMNDSNAQWRADYEYEMRRLATGDGNSSIASVNIKSIIGIENNIGAGNYADALTALGSFTASNLIEQNYKDVLTVFANVNYPTKREPTELEINTLTSIAEQFPRTAGASVTLARTFLTVKYNIYFKDEKFTDGVAYGTATIQAPCSMSPASGTVFGFMDNLGNDLEISGTMVEEDGTFAFDPYQMNYYNSLHPDVTYRIYSKYGSRFTVVDTNFRTLPEWIALSPFTLSLSGVTVDMDTITSTEYQSIGNVTHVYDTEGNLYSIGATSSPNSDFLLEKYSPSNDLIWTRTFDGPVSGDDTATCMTIDNANMIYVAGKVWNGKNYDYQTLKYSTAGYLQWTSILADSAQKNSEPTGIIVDENDGSVNITGNYNQSEYRFARYYQCLPEANRIGHETEEQQIVETNSIEFYPNPSNGTINLVLNNVAGGTLELFNLAGQLVYSQMIVQSVVLDLPQKQVPDGVYLLKFTGAGNPQFNKVVINRN